jgi:hypothetical protein
VDSCYFQKFTQDVTNRFHTLNIILPVTVGIKISPEIAAGTIT